MMNQIIQNNKKLKQAGILLFVLFTGIINAQAQTTSGNSSAPSYFTNALFLTLLIIIVLLLFFIAAIANVTKNVSRFYEEKNRKEREAGKATAAVVLFLLLGNSLQAANPNVIPTRYISGIDYTTFYLMLGIIACEISVLLILINTIKTLVYTDTALQAKKEESKPKVKKKTIIDSLNASVEIEKEADILLDHNYDGIKELDNNLPPWWKIGFYLTIVWAVIYLVHYHISETGDLQLAEYNKELKTAELQKAEYMKNAANNVDESNVKQLTDASDLNAAKEIFISTCAACHGKLGEGTVGPNLTDSYWLHKGGLPDIFKSIKYGWPDKGMKAWKEDLSPVQMAQLSSYVMSLKGSNPPNPKAAQGDLYTETISSSDSLSIAKTDTLNSSLQKDSLLQGDKK